MWVGWGEGVDWGPVAACAPAALGGLRWLLSQSLWGSPSSAWADLRGSGSLVSQLPLIPLICRGPWALVTWLLCASLSSPAKRGPAAPTGLGCRHVPDRVFAELSLSQGGCVLKPQVPTGVGSVSTRTWHVPFVPLDLESQRTGGMFLLCHPGQ